MGNVRMRAEQINYGATNVKVALDDLDPAALIELNNRMNKIDAWKATVKTEEKTGAELTFTNALALAAVSLSAEIEAVQDLHGYDKPWVGGAGKNKLQNTLTTTTIYGVTFTVNSDGTVTANGKATGGHAQFQMPITGLSGDFGFDGCPSGGAEGKYDVYAWDTTTNARVQKWDGTTRSDSDFDSASLKQIKLPSEHNFLIVLRVFEGFTANNLVFKPMICASTETDPTFAPYSNICPISGHSSVTITRTDAESQTADFTIQLGQTVYGGTLNATTGVLTVTHANIASYNGETINEPWISSLDEYTQGGTPTTGAQVVYTLAAPTTIQLTPEQLTMLKGYNRISADTGDITVEAYTGAAWGGDE